MEQVLDKELLKTVRRIEISVRRALDTVMAGAYHSSFKGNGMEFSEVREYVLGDDVRSIDWNVTARAGSPFIKKFVEERELTMLLVVDASASGKFGSDRRMKGEIMATISALLSFAAIRNNDKVGLLVCTDQVELVIPPAKGRKHVLRMVRELLYYKPEHRGTDLTVALQYAARILRRRAVVVVLSDFMTQGYEKAFKMLRRRHDVLALAVSDPREHALPAAGFITLEDPESGETLLVDSGDAIFRTAYARTAEQFFTDTAMSFKRMKIDMVPFPVQPEDKETLAPLLNYFRRRAREVRR
jgi:uncharacterized protein (DUF58 family)